MFNLVKHLLLSIFVIIIFGFINPDDDNNPDCSCSVGTQKCPLDAFSPRPPETKVIFFVLKESNLFQHVTENMLVNYMGRNID